MPQVALLGQRHFGSRLARQRRAYRRPRPSGPEETRATVGKFLGVCASKSLLIGLITDVSLRREPRRKTNLSPSRSSTSSAKSATSDFASAHFQRGVTTYPAMGDPVTFIGSRELRLIFHIPAARA